VGDDVIPAALVLEVAKAQMIPPAQALDLVIDDALAAAGARAAGLDKTPEARVATASVEARKIMLDIREQARAAGPATDEEVKEGSEAHWAEVDLPEQMRVIHALVVKPKVPDLAKNPGLMAQARALATALAATEADAVSEEDFEDRAKALVHDKSLEIKVEKLEPFIADGRQPNGPGLVEDFARGAVPLAVGTTSGVVQTDFGWHVIRMLERLPEHRVPFEERRYRFREEVIAVRARRALAKVQEDLVARFPVTISNGVEDLMTEGTMKFFGVERTGEASSP